MLKTDAFITRVIFRTDTTKEFKGTVFALFPQDEHNGQMVTYQRVGQHSYADYHHCISTSRPSKPSELTGLKKELIGLGYNLKIVLRKSYKHKPLSS